MTANDVPPPNEIAVRELRSLLGDRVIDEQGVCIEHGHDVSHHPSQPPDAVAVPQSTEEVATIVEICNRHRLPIIPYGTGTAVEGGVVAISGGVCIDLRQLNQIVEVHPQDMDVCVQAGVTRKQLNKHLEASGSPLYFPVDPGADASLGGMAATCASGSSAVRYGTMRDNVLELTVVLASGQVIQTGTRARKSSAGYDLTGLFVGSEGTLGIITALTLKLTARPKSIAAAVCSFEGIDPAVNTAIEIISTGIPMARIELLDDVQMAAVNSYSGLNYQVAPTLFFEFHGSEAGVHEQVQQVEEIVCRNQGGEFQWAVKQDERDRLWQARHDAYYASLALRPDTAGYVTDVCVPISQLAECIHRAKAELKRSTIPAPLFGHVGDGNFHVVFPIHSGNQDELQQVKRYSERIIEHALELGGTCTGEHGIGIGKRDSLIKEHGPAIETMKAVKQALDPLNLMNPGKVLMPSE